MARIQALIFSMHKCAPTAGNKISNNVVVTAMPALPPSMCDGILYMNNFWHNICQFVRLGVTSERWFRDEPSVATSFDARPSPRPLLTRSDVLKRDIDSPESSPSPSPFPDADIDLALLVDTHPRMRTTTESYRLTWTEALYYIENDTPTPRYELNTHDENSQTSHSEDALISTMSNFATRGRHESTRHVHMHMCVFHWVTMIAFFVAATLCILRACRMFGSGCWQSKRRVVIMPISEPPAVCNEKSLQ